VLLDLEQSILGDDELVLSKTGNLVPRCPAQILEATIIVENGGEGPVVLDFIVPDLVSRGMEVLAGQICIDPMKGSVKEHRYSPIDTDAGLSIERQC
jgi:hypothetical protein